MISGERSSIASTNASNSSNFTLMSFFRFSPSTILVSTNCVNAPSKAFFNPFQSSSSFSGCSSIVSTSGQRDKVETRISFSNENASSICLKYCRYSSANAALYFNAAWFSDMSSYVIKISTFPRCAYCFSRLRMEASKKFNFFGIRILTSKYLWFTPFSSTVNLRCPSDTSHLPKPVILFIILLTSLLVFLCYISL